MENGFCVLWFGSQEPRSYRYTQRGSLAKLRSWETACSFCNVFATLPFFTTLLMMFSVFQSLGGGLLNLNFLNTQLILDVPDILINFYPLYLSKVFNKWPVVTLVHCRCPVVVSSIRGVIHHAVSRRIQPYVPRALSFKQCDRWAQVKCLCCCLHCAFRYEPSLSLLPKEPQQK